MGINLSEWGHISLISKERDNLLSDHVCGASFLQYEYKIRRHCHLTNGTHDSNSRGGN